MYLILVPVVLCRNYAQFVERAMRVRRLIADDYDSVFKEVDLLLTPVTSDTAVRHSEFRRAEGGYAHERADDYFTQPVNMAGKR